MTAESNGPEPAPGGRTMRRFSASRRLRRRVRRLTIRKAAILRTIEITYKPAHTPAPPASRRRNCAGFGNLGGGLSAAVCVFLSSATGVATTRARSPAAGTGVAVLARHRTAITPRHYVIWRTAPPDPSDPAAWSPPPGHRHRPHPPRDYWSRYLLMARTVGLPMKFLRLTLTPVCSTSRATRTVASREWPPRSKKLSSTPT